MSNPRFVEEVIDWNSHLSRLAPGFLAALQNADAVEQATIPVENSRGRSCSSPARMIKCGHQPSSLRS